MNCRALLWREHELWDPALAFSRVEGWGTRLSQSRHLSQRCAGPTQNRPTICSKLIWQGVGYFRTRVPRKNSRFSHLAIKKSIHSRTKFKFTRQSVKLLWVFDMAVARTLLFAIAILRFFIQLRTESMVLQGLQKVILPQIRFGWLKKHVLYF